MLEFDKGYYCKNCEYIINKQKYQIDKKILTQDRDFSTRLNYANKTLRDIWTSLVNSTFNSTEDMIKKLQELKGKTELKFYKNLSNYSKDMKNKNFKAKQDPFSKNAQVISKIYHEVLLIMKHLQTKLQIKIMNINFYDLYYTVIRIRDENKDVDIQYEDDENEYINFNAIISPNHYI